MQLMKGSFCPRKLRRREVGDRRRAAKCIVMRRRLRKSVMAFSMFSVWATLSSCTFDPNPDRYLRPEVERLQRLTIPPESHVVDGHPPEIQGWVARASWEFQTNYSAGAYNSWVVQRLRPDFRVDGSPNSSTRFSKYVQGDVEVMWVVTVPFDGKLRVIVQLEICPD